MSSPSPRAALVLFVLALFAGVVGWSVLDRPEATAGDADAIGRADREELAREEAALAPASAPLDPDGAPEPARVEAEAVRAVADALEATPADESETITLLSGTVTLMDADGTRNDAPSGVLRLVVGGEHIGTGEDVEVTDGRFELTALLDPDGSVRREDDGAEYRAPLDQLRCTCLRFGAEGRGAMLFCDAESGEALDDGPTFPARTADVSVAVRLAPALTLHVRDGASGVALTGVEVRASLGYRPGRHPEARGRSRPVVEGAASPVEVPPTTRIAGRTEVALHVRAEGYAWDMITVDMSARGERTIELDPGGALDVTLEGEVPRGASIRLREGAAGRPVVDIGLSGRAERRIEALPPGPYEVAVEVGDWFADPVRVGHATVEVVAGTASAVAIPVEAPGPARTADISGVFVLPPAWGDDRPRLTLRRLTASSSGASRYTTISDNDITPYEGTPGHFRFAKSSLETGRYKLDYGPFDASILFDLPPAGRSDLLLQVGAPVDVTVRVVDADTGLDATGVDNIWWRVAPGDDDVGGSLEVVHRDAETGLFECRVPRGPVAFVVYGPTSGDLTITEAIDGMEANLEVKTHTTATVLLRSGDDVVPWPSGVRFEVEQVDGDGTSDSSGMSDGEHWFGVSEPGRYRIEIPEIDGFLPHEPVEVDLAAGESTRVVVELIPK